MISSVEAYRQKEEQIILNVMGEIKENLRPLNDAKQNNGKNL